MEPVSFSLNMYHHCHAVVDPGFSPGGAPTPKSAIIFQFSLENCMKMKEFGPPGGGGPGASLRSATVGVLLKLHKFLIL